MTLDKGIYYRVRKEIKNSALCIYLILKIPGICVILPKLGVVGLFWDSWFTLSLLSLGIVYTLSLYGKEWELGYPEPKLNDSRTKHNGIRTGVAESY